MRLFAPSNIVMGQTLEGVVDVFDSNLVFKEGEVLAEGSHIVFRSREDAEKFLYFMLDRVKRLADSKGVLPNPFSGDVGNLDLLNFYDIVEQMVAERGYESRVVTIFAASDIYTEGPVKVRMEVGEEPKIKD
jgi:hypothetical protein